MSTPKKLLASGAVLAAVGAFVSFGVFSSWSDTDSNSSSLQAGSLSITRNTPANLIDTLTGLIPGDIVTRCVKVTKGGDIASTVSMSPDVTSANALAGALQASVEEGSALTNTDGSCTGFLSTGFLFSTTDVTAFGGAKTLSQLDGVSKGYTAVEWANGDAKYYRVTLALPTNAVDTLQGLTGTFNIDWTATQPSGNTGR